VPETLRIGFDAKRRPYIVRADAVPGPVDAETYIPVSALLSDEVVERLARLLAERDGWDWDHDGTSVTRDAIASHARIYLEKLTEQIGGAR